MKYSGVQLTLKVDWNRLNSQAQGVINCRNSSWRPALAPSSVPHGSREGPVLFNTFIRALNGESTLTTSAVHTTLRAVDDMPSSCVVFQRDLGRWRNGLMGPKWILTRRSAKSCAWRGVARNNQRLGPPC